MKMMHWLAGALLAVGSGSGALAGEYLAGPEVQARPGDGAAESVLVQLADTTAPKLTRGPSVSMDTKRWSLRVLWTTDEASTTEVYIRLAGSSSNFQSFNNLTLVTSHTSVSIPVSRSTRYEYFIRSVDRAGNAMRLGPYYYTTPSR